MAYTKKRLFNNRCNAVTDCVLVRHSGVDTGGIAHFTGDPDAKVVVVAVLPYKLGLEYAVRAADEERRCAAAVNNGHLEGVCLPLLDGEGAGRVAADRALLDVCRKGGGWAVQRDGAGGFAHGSAGQLSW